MKIPLLSLLTANHKGQRCSSRITTNPFLLPLARDKERSLVESITHRIHSTNQPLWWAVQVDSVDNKRTINRIITLLEWITNSLVQWITAVQLLITTVVSTHSQNSLLSPQITVSALCSHSSSRHNNSNSGLFLWILVELEILEDSNSSRAIMKTFSASSLTLRNSRIITTMHIITIHSMACSD